jgi:hypothetical protein
LVKKPDDIPQTPRETLEAHRCLLKGKAGEPDMQKALLEPTWAVGEAPGTEVLEFAHLGVFTLYAAKTTDAQHKQAPKGAARISWSLVSEKANDLLAGGGAASMEDAKEYAYLAYQAAHGFIRGGDA